MAPRVASSFLLTQGPAPRQGVSSDEPVLATRCHYFNKYVSTGCVEILKSLCVSTLHTGRALCTVQGLRCSSEMPGNWLLAGIRSALWALNEGMPCGDHSLTATAALMQQLAITMKWHNRGGEAASSTHFITGMDWAWMKKTIEWETVARRKGSV